MRALRANTDQQQTLSNPNPIANPTQPTPQNPNANAINIPNLISQAQRQPNTNGHVPLHQQQNLQKLLATIVSRPQALNTLQTLIRQKQNYSPSNDAVIQSAFNQIRMKQQQQKQNQNQIQSNTANSTAAGMYL